MLATSTAKLGELSLDGARAMPLEPLSERAGLLLLADRCGEERVAAEPDAAKALVDHCSGLPVALHVAAARLANNPHLTLHDLATELSVDENRLASLNAGLSASPVTAILDASYRQLPAHMAHGYRLLGWIPGPTFDAATAAAALDSDPTSAQVLLDVLEDMSLLELTEDRHYHFHGLIHLHARNRTDAADRVTTRLTVIHRVLRHYLILTAFADRAVRADRLRIADLAGLLDGQTDPFAAENGPGPLDWLAAESTNIMAVLRAADEPSLHTPAWQLAEGFTVLFLHHRHLDDWQESLRLGARYAAAAVSPAAEARLRSLLSRPLMDLGEDEQARQELTTAISCAEVVHDPVLHASVMEFSGRYWDRFDPDKAVAAYQHSRELNIRGREPRGAAIATLFLGRAQGARGDHGEALATLRQARTDLLALPTPDHRMAARATAASGRALDRMGRTTEAVATLREAANTLNALEAHAYEAEALLDLVAIAERPGTDRTTLLDDLRRAVTIHTTMGSPQAQDLRNRLNALTASAGPDR
ncbi:tetratricopeptide repeat protein [Streptomyces triticagri]|uniref:tetratricopeptide repeat protein n=1 Tax=Streptomyces triticagri TaxID=2293568 RepID=UPI0013149542|nr:tetratricopeptide repeat protein [Streptomyces triticagri]